MTFKAAAADLPAGGGKIVLMESDSLVRDEALKAVGRPIEVLGGRFLAGRDVGVPVADGALVRSETSFMVDESEAGVSDLNRATAIGVEAGARAALAFATGATSWSGWKGARVAIQGAGGVGTWLARILFEKGADLFVSDPNPRALAELRKWTDFQDVEGTASSSSSATSLRPAPLEEFSILHARAVSRPEQSRAPRITSSPRKRPGKSSSPEALSTPRIIW
jgi:leucine dehydrogenase